MVDDVVWVGTKHSKENYKWYKQGQIDLLKEIKSMRGRFAIESEGDEFILDFLKRKMKTEKVV
jgi:hypothetical protein